MASAASSMPSSRVMMLLIVIGDEVVEASGCDQQHSADGHDRDAGAHDHGLPGKVAGLGGGQQHDRSDGARSAQQRDGQRKHRDVFGLVVIVDFLG